MRALMKTLRTASHLLLMLGMFLLRTSLFAADPSEATITSPAGPITVTANQPISFAATSSDSWGYDKYKVNSMTWDFGDGTPAVSGTLPSGATTHAYAGAGTFTATLTVSYTGSDCTRYVTGPSGEPICQGYQSETRTAIATRVITVAAPAPTISSFTASPATVASGGPSTLSWTTTNATSLSISGIGPVTGTSKVVNPTTTTTYTLTATNAAGSVTANVTVNVSSWTLPSISSFTASPSTVTSGGASTLSWTTTNATSLSISGIGTVTGTSKVVNPTATTTYTLTATNAAGSVTANVTVTVPPPATPTISHFTASPTAITSGGSSTLSWSTANATSLSISGIGPVTGTTSKVVNPTATTTYTLTATNAAGSVTANVTVNVSGWTLPSISSFTASPSTVTSGGASTLSWATTNATSLSISGIGTVTGTSIVVNPTATTTYTLTAASATGSVTANVTVNVSAWTLPSISSFTASPTTVAPGGASTLSWTTANATSLSISGIGPVTGTSIAVNPTATTTYTLTAASATGSVTANVTVTVTAAALPTISSFTASPTTVTPGSPSTLSWTTTNATSLSISGVGTVTGTSKVVNPTATTTYTLTASNAAGSVTANVAVTVSGSVMLLKRNVIYVGTKEVAEVDAQGAVRITLVDHLGSPRYLVGPTGALETKQKFLPFGETLSDPASAAKFAKGFTNHEQTDPSGLIYMQARYYLPMYGRFASPDPALDQHYEQTQSWNIYSYVQNDPVTKTDPTGMLAEGLTKKIWQWCRGDNNEEAKMRKELIHHAITNGKNLKEAKEFAAQEMKKAKGEGWTRQDVKNIIKDNPIGKVLMEDHQKAFIKRNSLPVDSQPEANRDAAKKGVQDGAEAAKATFDAVVDATPAGKGKDVVDLIDIVTEKDKDKAKEKAKDKIVDKAQDRLVKKIKEKVMKD